MSDEPTAEDLADGMALWQENRPQTREDWLRVAERCQGEALPNPSPMFGALFDAVAERDALAAEVERLRRAMDAPLQDTILAVLKRMPREAAPEQLVAMIEKQVQARQTAAFSREDANS